MLDDKNKKVEIPVREPNYDQKILEDEGLYPEVVSAKTPLSPSEESVDYESIGGVYGIK